MCLDSPSVTPPAIGDAERGHDGGKKIKGRKRPIIVDALGLLVAVLLTSAGLDDGRAASQLLALLAATAFPRVETIFGETTYHHYTFDDWLATHRPAWQLALTTRPAGPPV
ncbi:MAG: transposase [Candidatus Tectimicrobiota bacterium]